MNKNSDEKKPHLDMSKWGFLIFMIATYLAFILSLIAKTISDNMIIDNNQARTLPSLNGSR